MTYPRAHLVDRHNGGFYHCMSRCVRHGWLCGLDSVSGRSYEHRKDWVESRILELCDVFTIKVYGYAVMSNHYHIVVQVAPGEAVALDDEEVARRWLRLSPHADTDERERRLMALLDDPERLWVLRERLGSLSWFMRYINEPIARAANREDDCKGRFWEGRFKSVALLDESAVIGCLAYVDLNPVRAKMTTDVERGAHTSINRRVMHRDATPGPLASLESVGLTLSSYQELLAWTVGVHVGKVHEPGAPTRQTLRRMGHDPATWLSAVKAHRLKYRAYGALDKLKRYAESLGQRWVHGGAALRTSGP